MSKNLAIFGQQPGKVERAHTLSRRCGVGDRRGEGVAPIEVVSIGIVILVVPHDAGARRARLQAIEKRVGLSDAQELGNSL